MRTTLVLAAIAASFGVQETPRQVFRSGVDLVTIDTIVVDRDGRPVTDLTAADFAVTAGKKGRKVRTAEFVAISTAREPVPAPAAATEAEPVPSVTSNAGMPEARSFLIVVDVDQIRTGEGKVAMRALSDFVSSLGANDLAGVVALPYGRPRVDLTRDRASLTQALERIVGASRVRDDVMSVGEAYSIERGDRTVLEDWSARGACKINYPDCPLGPKLIAEKLMREQRRSSSNLFDTLSALAAAMKPLRGLKTIVLVSEGMVRDREVTDHLRGFAETAAEARVTLYSLALDAPQTESIDGMTKPPDRRLDSIVRTDGMADAASAGGGSLFLVSGTADNALKRIDTELSGYYLLSFESEPSDVTDKRRNVEVRVRRPGVTVRVRTDYSVPVPAPSKPAAPVDARARMSELLKFPVPISEVPIDLATFLSPAAHGTTERRVIIAADLPAGTRPAAAGFEVADETGKVVSDAFEPAPALTTSDGRSSWFGAVRLNPGRYQLKFGLVTADDRRGSVQHSVWVRPSPPAPLRLGDIVIGREDAGGFTPIARVPEGAVRLSVHVELLAAEASAFDGASVLLDIVRKGEPAPFTSATMPTEATGSPLRRIATAALTIGRLPAGEYILRCTLQGGSSTERVTRLIAKR
jgi:VWFA-related protein